MKAPIRVCILKKSVASLFVEYAELFLIFVRLHCKVIPINKVITSIIGRININHLDLTQITFLQELQHFQIVALNIEIFSRVPIHTLFRAGTQRFTDGPVGLHNGRFLAHPGKFICFVPLGHIAGQHLSQQVEVDRLFQLSVLTPRLRHAVGE